jgi:multiple sugar transport system substrate-binding protein
MKRALAAGLVLACALPVFATGTQEAGAKGQPAQISWLMRANPFENKWEQEVAIPAFEKLNPGITVQIIIVPFDQVDPKLSTMVAAGTPPDVFSMWGASGFGDYYTRGLLLDLTDHVKRDIDMNEFVDGVFNIYAVKGRYYHVPQVTNFGVLMAYNKDLFAKAGLGDLPTRWQSPDWTWKTMVADAAKLTQNYGKGVDAQYGVYFSAPDNLLHQVSYIWGADPYLPEQYTSGIAPRTNLADPAVAAALQHWQDLIHKDKVSPGPAESRMLEQLGNIIATGKVGMTTMLATQAYGNLKSAPFKWGLAPLPLGKDTRTALFNGAWFIAKASKHPDEAWKLIKYLTTRDAADAFSRETGFLVPRKDAVEGWLDLFTKPTGMTKDQLREVITQYPRTSVENTNHLFVAWPEMRTTILQAMDPFLFGEIDAKGLTASLGPKLDAIVKRIYDANKK